MNSKRFKRFKKKILVTRTSFTHIKICIAMVVFDFKTYLRLQVSRVQ